MSVESRIANVEQSLTRIETTLEDNLPKVTKQLYGSNGSPGMIVRVDRLEQASLRTRWALRLILASLTSIFLAGVWSLMTG
jgi:hypothetical protein